jgi:hypothetical protein
MDDARLGLVLMPLKKENEREQTRREHNQKGGVFRVHGAVKDERRNRALSWDLGKT